MDDSNNQLRSTRTVPNASKQLPFVHVPSRVEVTVHKAYEEHQMSHTNHFSTPFSGSDGQLHDKPHEISFDENTENTEDRVEK